MTTALALDLGTTRIKAGLLSESGALAWTISGPAPDLHGSDPVRESNAMDYLAAAEAVLAKALTRAPRGTPLGMASQRSSFLLWERRSGQPVTPLVSWQDRRAAAWCADHARLDKGIRNLTGLPLSPHYAGPKLAHLILHSKSICQRVETGELLFGTLDSFLIWRWSNPSTHATDLTMAARTLLVDPQAGDWSPFLMNAFGVPGTVLPSILPTRGFDIALRNGLHLKASIADQAAVALAVFGNRKDVALVNLGTGGFVLRPTGGKPRLTKGFLSGPIFGGTRGRALFAAEGTINGAGAAVDPFGRGPTDLLFADPSPDAFCLPDTAGVGAPHWVPEISLTFSEAGESQTTRGKRRLVLEGLLFRIREILEGLSREDPPARILLAGGLAEDPFVSEGLAACLEQPVEVLEQTEGTLLGAARLAAGLDPCAHPGTRTVEPSRRGAYLPAKYPAWKAWLEAVLAKNAV